MIRKKAGVLGALAGRASLAAFLAANAASAEPGAVQTSVVYVGDWLRNTTGGMATGSAYLQDIDLTASASLDRWLGPGAGTLFADLLWNNDATFSGRYTGDAQSVSNIDAPRALRLYELWYEHSFPGGFGLRVGLYDLNTEFDAMNTAGLFLNGSHGIGAQYGLTGRRGPSIFPQTSFAARMKWQIDERHLLRYAVLDAVPGDPNDPSATSIEFNSGEGFLHALEYNFAAQRGARFGVGAFHYTEQFERIDQTGAQDTPARDDGNRGVYVFADVPVFESPGGGRALNAFVRYGVANEELNPFGAFLGAGAVLSHPFPARPDDQLGIAFASARTGDDYRLAFGSERHETSFEVTYSAQINDWLRLQPNLQYIVHPGVDRNLDDALTVGLRVEISRHFGLN